MYSRTTRTFSFHCCSVYLTLCQISHDRSAGFAQLYLCSYCHLVDGIVQYNHTGKSNVIGFIQMEPTTPFSI